MLFVFHARAGCIKKCSTPKTKNTMASTEETGHAKIVAALESLISISTAFGVQYNPSKAALKLPALATQLTAGGTVMQTVKNANVGFNNAVNARAISFKPLQSLATKVVNALAATDAAAETVADAQSANLKIQGKRAKAIEKPATTTGTPAAGAGKNVSVSQQSFDKLIEHFTQLIATLTAEPLYIPNEANLKVAALNTVLADLKAKNSAVINADTAAKNARIARDKTLYGKGTGIVDTALEVKKYVKSLFGATSPQYKQVSGLKFVNRPGKK
jgi:hypothetical protein